MSRKEYFESILLDDRFRLARQAGAHLSPNQESLLKDILYEGYLVAMGHTARPMTPRQRNQKSRDVNGLRTAMAEVSFYSHTIGNVSYQVPTWLTARDVRKIVSPGQVSNLVSDLCKMFGREYRDPILVALRDAYVTEGERIQIVRDPA